MKKNKMFTLIAIISGLLLIIGWFLPETPGMILEIVAATTLFIIGILSWVVPNNEKTTLKLIILISVYLALLSWIIDSASTSGGEVASLGLRRMSLYNFIEYPYLTLQFFLQPLLFILAVGGLYGVLSETGKFRNKLEKIAKSLKGKEIAFLIITSFLLAAINSITGLNLILFIVIPAIVGIVLLMGYDKITAFLTGFIPPIIGIIGSTYAYQINGYINQIVGSEYSTEMVAKVALFILSFLIYTSVLISHAKKVKGKDAKVTEEDLAFLGEKKQSKKASWPIFLIMGLLLLVAILGCTNWLKVFEIEFFNELHTTITTWSVKDHTIVAYLIGDIKSFGNWTVAEMTVMVLISSLLLSVIYKLKLNDGIKAFGKGVLKVVKPAILLTIACAIVITTAYHPFLVTITDWMIGSIVKVGGIGGELLFILMGSLNTMLSTILNIDMIYVVQATVPYIVATYPDYANVIAIMTQSIYGLTLLVAPTSTLLLLGLTYLEIPYKEWLKASWKLFTGLLVIILIIISVVTFI